MTTKIKAFEDSFDQIARDFPSLNVNGEGVPAAVIGFAAHLRAAERDPISIAVSMIGVAIQQLHEICEKDLTHTQELVKIITERCEKELQK